ncbi:hypothetical protein DXV65_20460 [Pseudomonas fluorescens]|nr:hypothetical protein DXV65_20460 [Pseudomonas fluorescens]
MINTVGSGLPAKAVYQSPHAVADRPLSQASQLPHLGCISSSNGVVPSARMLAKHLESKPGRRSKLWELACLRWQAIRRYKVN